MSQINNFRIGTDVEDIKRFRKMDRIKNRLFLNKIFTENELDYCFSKTAVAQHLAVRYAGKEAIVKALSDFNQQVISYKDIEILNNKIGAPIVKINNKQFKNMQINISLSHSKEIVVAFALVTKS